MTKLTNFSNNWNNKAKSINEMRLLSVKKSLFSKKKYTLSKDKISLSCTMWRKDWQRCMPATLKLSKKDTAILLQIWKTIRNNCRDYLKKRIKWSKVKRKNSSEWELKWSKDWRKEMLEYKIWWNELSKADKWMINK